MRFGKEKGTSIQGERGLRNRKYRGGSTYREKGVYNFRGGEDVLTRRRNIKERKGSLPEFRFHLKKRKGKRRSKQAGDRRETKGRANNLLILMKRREGSFKHQGSRERRRKVKWGESRNKEERTRISNREGG